MRWASSRWTTSGLVVVQAPNKAVLKAAAMLIERMNMVKSPEGDASLGERQGKETS
jgi:hypothetical protein